MASARDFPDLIREGDPSWAIPTAIITKERITICFFPTGPGAITGTRNPPCTWRIRKRGSTAG